MKYKDLKMGDWFIYNGEHLIKTQNEYDEWHNFYIDGAHFGERHNAIDEDEEVDFLTKISYVPPNPELVGKTFSLRKAPSYVLLRCKEAPEIRFIIFARYMIDVGNTYCGNYNGYWNDVNELCDVPVEIMGALDLDFPEEKWKRLRCLWEIEE